MKYLPFGELIFGESRRGVGVGGGGGAWMPHVVSKDNTFCFTSLIIDLPLDTISPYLFCLHRLLR